MKKFIVEFIGTAFFVFVIGMSTLTPGLGILAPLVIGLTLTIMVYTGGHISGGHFNPAVTFGVFLRGKMPAIDVIPYWIAQISAALLASYMVIALKGYPNAPCLEFAPGRALFAEFIGAFALVWVVLNTATAKANAGNSFFGLAIGLTVTVMAYTVGSFSGGAFNPAVALGLGTLNIIPLPMIWLHVVANLSAGAIAATVFKGTSAKE